MDWVRVIVGAAIGAVGWMAIQIVGLGRSNAVLERRADAGDEDMKEIKKKLDQVAEDTQAIRVALGESPHV